MKAAKEWADALIAMRPSMVAGQDVVDFAQALTTIVETIQRDALDTAPDIIDIVKEIASDDPMQYADPCWSCGITQPEEVHHHKCHYRRAVEAMAKP